MKEILEKIAKGEALTEAEIKQLEKFNADMLEKQAELDRVKAEKEDFSQKLANANTELQIKLTELSDKEAKLTEIETKKKEIEELIKEANTKADLDAKMAENKKRAEELLLEKQKQDAIKEAELKAQKLIEEKEKETKAFKEQVKKLEEEQSKIKFQNLIMSEKVKRPYLENGLNKILDELEVKGVESSKIVFDFLVESVDHDAEMAKFKMSQSAGSSVFSDKKVIITTEDKKTDTKKDKLDDEERVLEFARKNGYKMRNTK